MGRRKSSTSRGGEDLSSLFDLSTATIAEQLAAMLETESRPQYHIDDYLSPSTASTNTSRRSTTKRKQKRCTPESRSQIVKWLHDVADYLALPRESVSIAMSLTDRFMSVPSRRAEKALTDVTGYQLVAVSSLFIAAKNDSIHCLVDANTFVNASHGSYTAREIVDMESAILQSVEWRVCGTTSRAVAGHAIALLNKIVHRRAMSTCSSARLSARAMARKGAKKQIQTVVDFTRLQVELSVGDYELCVAHKPSTLAVASVLNSIELLDLDGSDVRSFSRTLEKLVGLDINSGDVESARHELHRVFDAQSESVMERSSRRRSLYSEVSDQSISLGDATPLPTKSRYVAPSPCAVNMNNLKTPLDLDSLLRSYAKS
mmetsp:Transcript_19736/g.43953  ORF Transcript_19736/g.43953 Transcript_19736/m.43953 type:complete len:374 (+) Transcript_19736:65-1186(+)